MGSKDSGSLSHCPVALLTEFVRLIQICRKIQRKFWRNVKKIWENFRKIKKFNAN